jgi:hypothetical protein
LLYIFLTGRFIKESKIMENIKLSIQKDKKLNLTFPALASLTLSACGGGGGGGGQLIAPNPNSAPTVVGTTTVSMDEDSSNIALSISTPTDSDGDSLTVTVTGLPTGGTLTTADGTEVTNDMTLTISQLTGLIFTPDLNLNDDNTSFGSFTYSVSDGSLTSTGTVNISVTPVNDAPEFTSGPDINIEENHSDVTGFTATDVDDDTLTYSISGGDDQSFFTIDAATGALTFIDRQDFENAQDSDANNIYIVEITIDDGNGGTATQTFNIIVSDVVTGITISNLSIDENASGAVVGDLTAAIDDLNATHEYTYALSGTDADSFDVVDGQLKLKDSVSANYEVKNSYTVTVTATDSGGLTTSEVFTVTINDVNDAPTGINISRTGLMDNTDAAVVGWLATVDEDAVDNHTYTVSDDRFEVVDGVLKLKAGQSIDNVAEPTITLTVTTTDKGGLTYQEEFTLTVGTVQVTSTQFEENATGVVIGSLSVIDTDFSGTITYTLSGEGSENFEVVDGQLKLKDGVSANYEVINSYSITIIATDDSGYTNSTTYPFSVTDINEAPTAIALSSTAIDENSAGAVVGDLTTTDEDIGDSHTYTLSGDDFESFEVVDGQLKLRDGVSFNYEVKSSYTVTVTATDSGGLSISTNYTISVNDINDAPTGINLSGSLFVNDGNTGGVVGNLTTTDEDAVDNHSYSLSGSDAEMFEVVDGQLKLKDSVTPSGTNKASYTLTVTTTDKGGATFSRDYTVEVNVAPTDLALDSFNVDENYIGASVGSFVVTDVNTDDEYTYSLSGDDANSFEVVDGSLKVKSGTWLDYETKTTYTVTVTVTDQGGLTFEKTVTINANDVNYGNPYHNENFTTGYGGLPTDTSILGQLWTYYYVSGTEYDGWGDYYIGLKHDSDPNTPLVITYSLIDSNSVLGPNYDGGDAASVYENRSDYSAEWEAIVDQAFAYWGNVSGITFVKVDDNESMCGDIRIGLSTGDFGNAGGWSLIPYYYDSSDSSLGVSDANDIWVRKDYDPEVYGSYYGPTIMIHEIGHSLGLSHTQMYPTSSIEQNTTLWSVMAYVNTGAYIMNDWDDYSNWYIFGTMPGINDIKTIQYIYGMTPENNEGNTTYTYSGPVWETIYDTGGIDTIDLSSYSLDITLNLVGGNISYIGTDELKIEKPWGNGSDDWDYAYSGFPISIYDDTIIENAITGSGNDSITCNAASNTITCGYGNDNIYAIGSNDIIIGGHGYDNFYIQSFDFVSIDGGTGTNATDGEGDSLYFFGNYTDQTIDLRSFTDAQLTGIEDININDGKATILKISEQALKDLEGTYTRDLDGDGIQETVHYIYTYGDSTIDQVQVNMEGWTLVTGLTIDEENVYEGYDYYSSSDGTIWFAVNTGTSVVEISSTGSTNLNDFSSDGLYIADYNKDIENEESDSNGNDLYPITDDATDESITLPETIEFDTPIIVNLSKPELLDLLIDEEVFLEEEIIISAIENINDHGSDLTASNEIMPDSFDPINKYDLFNFYDEGLYHEDLIYTSELG